MDLELDYDQQIDSQNTTYKFSSSMDSESRCRNTTLRVNQLEKQPALVCDLFLYDREHAIIVHYYYYFGIEGRRY